MPMNTKCFRSFQTITRFPSRCCKLNPCQNDLLTVPVTVELWDCLDVLSFNVTDTLQHLQQNKQLCQTMQKDLDKFKRCPLTPGAPALGVLCVRGLCRSAAGEDGGTRCASRRQVFNTCSLTSELGKCVQHSKIARLFNSWVVREGKCGRLLTVIFILPEAFDVFKLKLYRKSIDFSLMYYFVQQRLFCFVFFPSEIAVSVNIFSVAYQGVNVG